MEDIIKEKIKNLIALRNNYFSMIIVISTGIASLLLLDFNFVKFITSFIILFYFEVTFILKFEFVSNKIDDLLKEGSD